MSESSLESTEPRDPFDPERLLETVVSNAPIVLFAADSDGVITLSRGQALHDLGLDAGELIGTSLFDLYRTEPALADAARRSLAGEGVLARLQLDGRVHETLFAPLYFDGDQRGVIGIATDITDRAAAEALIEFQATHDHATGLLNRPEFARRLDAALQDPLKPPLALTVLVVLLDRFQEISETFGHTVGAEILRETAERISAHFPEDSLVAALEAGKFAVSLHSSSQDAVHLAESLDRALAVPYLVDGRAISLASYTGLGSYPEHAGNAELLIRASEKAARSAAVWKLGYAFYEPDAIDLKRNFTLLADLRSALANGSLFTEYQPLIDVKECAFTSVEALARWNHPRFGVIAPDEFIPLADRAGLLPEVTKLVFQTALSHLAMWEREGLELRAAINVSPLEILDPGIDEFIRLNAEDHGLDLTRIAIEVTESHRLGDVSERQSQLLRELTSDGVHLAIDDFGTGYSNLRSLQVLPWTELKVDRSFVNQMGRDTIGDELVRTIIGLAHSFGRAAIAEGVETRPQVDRLVELECDMLQGYHIAHPLAAELIPQFARDASWMTQEANS